MSSEPDRMECRSCGETFALDSDTCPHCGTAPRSTRGLGVLLVIGVLVGGVSVFRRAELWPFLVLGAIVVVVAGFLIKDQRDRVVEAA